MYRSFSRIGANSAKSMFNTPSALLSRPRLPGAVKNMTSSSSSSSSSSSQGGSNGANKQRGWRKYAHAFKDRPASHLTAFAILHEVTAVVPLVGVYYVINYFDLKVPFPEDALKEGNRYINKVRVYFGWSKLEDDSPILLHLATSYAIVKAAGPLRIAASVALTPWFARWIMVPFDRMSGRIGPSLRKPTVTSTNSKKPE
ncbi:hypothetical protein GGI12_003188 [Dipsacomyces acuminosporus]|nr:hypothetical protein GGI12_003188 [Dipsacomyces acuminosporus]